LDVTLGELEKAEEEGLFATANPKDLKTDALNDTKIEGLGFSVSKITPELRQLYNLGDKDTGVIITNVESDGHAADKGISTGDLISEVDQIAVSTPKDVTTRIENAKKEKRGSILLLLKNGTDMRFVALKIED